jgi:hypothetical protein
VRVSVRQAILPPAAALLAALALVGLVALTKPQAVVAYAHAHKLFVAGAATIGALALVLATALALMLRGGGSRVRTPPRGVAAEPRSPRRS